MKLGIWAIEYEISHAHVGIFPAASRWYSESSKISELKNFHLLKEKDRDHIHYTLKKMYKYIFPIGSDSHTSGGTHIHIFTDEETYNETNKTLSMWKILANNMLNCPLYAKIYQKKFFSRRNNRASLISLAENGTMESNSKINGITIKNRFSTSYTECGTYSVEFRINNVIDERIYLYYKGMRLLAEHGIELLPISKTKSLEIHNGMQYANQSMDYVHMKDLPGVSLSETDMAIVKNNIKVIFKELSKPEAKALREYCKEYGLL